MDTMTRAGMAAQQNGDADGRHYLVGDAPRLTPDQMAQVHQAEYLMDAGELERPQTELERLRADAAYIIGLLRAEGVRVNPGESAAEAVGNYITIVRNRQRKLEAAHD